MTFTALDVAAKTGAAETALDSAMPWLAAALDPARAAPEIAGSMSVRDRTAIEVQVFSANLVRHKAGRRCLIEYEVGITSGRRSRREFLIGKSRAKGVDRKTFELMGQLRSRGFNDEADDGIRVPEPLGIAPRFAMWLSRKVEGVSGDVEVTGSAGQYAGARIADAAHKIHSTSSLGGQSHTLGYELEILGARLTHVRVRHPEWASRVASLIRRCEEISFGIGERPVTGIHRDFYADQLLFDGRRLSVVDFDLYCDGDPALDIGNALAHLTEQSLRLTGGPNALDHVREALLDRYIVLAGESNLPAIRAYELFSLARHVSISDMKPDRSYLSGEILLLCEQLAGHAAARAMLR